MEPFLKSEIFFFISSVGFIMLTVLLSVVLVYAILIAHKVLAISKIAKKKSEEVSIAITEITKIAVDKTEEVGKAITDAKDFIAQGSVIHWIAYLFGSRTKKTTSKRPRSQD
jgi:F0F1-type ATP synthase membrane subunit b/b'